MATLGELIAQRDALLAIRRKGIKAYQITTPSGGSRTLTYRDDAELAAALADLERQISLQQGSGAISQIRIFSTKGL